jgi:hypothetical protein
MKETLALDFKTGEKSSGIGDDKINVNCYEVGGGRELSSLLQAPLSIHNIDNVASMCICIDSSNPLQAYDSALFWLQEVKKYSQQSLQ